MKKGRGKKILWGVVIVLLGMVAVIQITGNTYIYKALVYNFADIDDLDIFPFRIIANGSPQPWPVSEDYNKGRMPDSVRQELEKLKTVAYLVIQNDSIRYEEYWDGYNDTSMSNSFSMAKSVIGLLIGIALDEGKIKSLDEPIGNYLPDYREGKAATVTIRNLLEMSSGSSWDESYSSLFSVTTKAYYGNDLEKLMHQVKIIGDHGKVFEYKSGDTQLLAFILEKATGKHLADYASEKLWKRIGAERDAPWSLDHKDGHEKAYCCIYSNARDFARIGRLMLDSGEWKAMGIQSSMFKVQSEEEGVDTVQETIHGEQVVPLDYVRQTLSTHDLVYHDDPATKVYTYGYQWWLMNYKGHDIFYMRGLGGQYVFAIPDRRMIVVRLGRKREKIQRDRHPIEVDYILAGALKIIEN